MQSSRLAVFDLDRTIVTDNCSFSFCRYLVSQKVLPASSLFHSLFYYIRHIFFGLDLPSLHFNVFHALLKGESMEMIEKNVDPFLRNYLFSKIYPPVLLHLRRAQHLGCRTLMLSNSPSFLVSKVANMLGIEESYSTEYGVDDDHRLSHVVSIMQGEQKAAHVERIASQLFIEKGEISAYTDSFLDLPLLLSVGQPFAVNPDRLLRKFSRDHQWTIL